MGSDVVEEGTLASTRSISPSEAPSNPSEDRTWVTSSYNDSAGSAGSTAAPAGSFDVAFVVDPSVLDTGATVTSSPPLLTTSDSVCSNVSLAVAATSAIVSTSSLFSVVAVS